MNLSILKDGASEVFGPASQFVWLGIGTLLIAVAVWAVAARLRGPVAIAGSNSSDTKGDVGVSAHAAVAPTLKLSVQPEVMAFFDKDTNTVSFVVKDPASNMCAIIDSVMDLDYAAGRMSSRSADEIIAYVQAKGLTVEWLIETHVHADHLSAAPYIQEKLGGKLAIGEHIRTVQQVFGKIFNEGTRFQRDGSQFDRLFKEGDTYTIGTMQASVMHTPGHTPACTTHVIGNATFVGDTLFMPDGGTARTDFPGGDARVLYRSIKRLLSLPDEMRLFLCHDYAPGGREFRWETTVGEERRHNIHVRDGVSEDDFVRMRSERDATLAMPRLIIPSIQVNMRGGQLPEPDEAGKRFLKVPINGFETSPAQPAPPIQTAQGGSSMSTMAINILSDNFSVTPQIAVADVEAIASAGFKALLCNRPDGEAADQPSFAEIAAAAKARGLVVHHQPVVSGKVGGANVEEFGQLMVNLPKPVLAYCRTGTRSTQLWNLWQAE